MNAQDVVRDYGRLEYRAVDGQFYLLKAVYPICLPVSDKVGPNSFYLDTGSADGYVAGVDFFVARLHQVGEVFELQRMCDDEQWCTIFPEVRIQSRVAIVGAWPLRYGRELRDLQDLVDNAGGKKPTIE